MRVGNQVEGIEALPDYDREALQTRARVEDRLPDPLPGSSPACTAMLDAAEAHYARIEGNDARPVQTLRGTRQRDLTACTQQTSAAAATCVKILLSEDAGEYPWLLDQCSRAFPRS
jgi:hypothetical protein